MTARERYEAMVRDELAPWLRERGFKKRRQRFRRSDDAGWQVVALQASQWSSADDLRFTINLWVGVPELPGDAQIEERIGELIDGEDRWWTVDADTDTESLGAELRTLLAEHALPWLEARADLERLVALAERGPEDFPDYLLGRFAILLDQAGLDELSARVEAAQRRA
jgi:Domain of unknown function (DUF4304)